jgi:hypothetical protein
MTESHICAGPEPVLPAAAPASPAQRVPHSVQDDVVLRLALWVLMGGTAAESILATNPARPTS